MARRFNGSNQYLGYANISIDYPLTLVGWLKLAYNVGKVIVSIGNGSGTDYIALRTSASGVLVAAAFDGTTTTYSLTSGALSTGVWHHGAAVFNSSSSKLGYKNGVAGTLETTSANVTITRASIAVSADNTPFGYCYGAIAECAIYNKALSANEILTLSKKYSPLLVARSSLVAYWPLINGI